MWEVTWKLGKFIYTKQDTIIIVLSVDLNNYYYIYTIQKYTKAVYFSLINREHSLGHNWSCRVQLSSPLSTGTQMWSWHTVTLAQIMVTHSNPLGDLEDHITNIIWFLGLATTDWCAFLFQLNLYSVSVMCYVMRSVISNILHSYIS